MIFFTPDDGSSDNTDDRANDPDPDVVPVVVASECGRADGTRRVEKGVRRAVECEHARRQHEAER